MLFWIVLAAAAGAGGFIGCGYYVARRGGIKKVTFGDLGATAALGAGIVLSIVSLRTMYGDSIGKVGTPNCLDERIFYRVIGDLRTLDGQNIVGVQDAANKPYSVKSDCRAPRGAFVRLVEITPGKWDLEIIETNSPGPPLK